MNYGKENVRQSTSQQQYFGVSLWFKCWMEGRAICTRRSAEAGIKATYVRKRRRDNFHGRIPWISSEE
jgi:hypothetical protein